MTEILCQSKHHNNHFSVHFISMADLNLSHGDRNNFGFDQKYQLRLWEGVGGGS